LVFPGLIAAALALIVGSWFYLAMAAQTGTILAFNRPSDASQKPAMFFTGSGNGQLFTYPFAPAYDGQVLPIFYTEIWGDYFGFFYLPRPTLSYRVPISAVSYMSQVNWLSILPTLILIGGLLYGVRQVINLFLTRPSERTVVYSLFTSCTVTSIVGFVWFLARYPSLDADTAKATYVLHIFPPLCLLAADMLYVLQLKWPRLFQLVIILLTSIATHNILMYFSRISNL